MCSLVLIPGLPKLYGPAKVTIVDARMSIHGTKLIPPDRNRAGDLEICSKLYSLTLYQLSYGWVSDKQVPLYLP